MEQNQIDKLTVEYQKLQEQLQALALQREQFNAQKEEYKRAEEEVAKATGRVYTAIGGAIIETSKDECLRSVKERQEFVEMRLSIVGKQSDELSKKEQELRKQITDALKATKQ